MQTGLGKTGERDLNPGLSSQDQLVDGQSMTVAVTKPCPGKNFVMCQIPGIPEDIICYSEALIIDNNPEDTFSTLGKGDQLFGILRWTKRGWRLTKVNLVAKH